MKVTFDRVWLEKVGTTVEEEDINEEGKVDTSNEVQLNLRVAKVSFLLRDVRGWEEVTEPYASIYKNLGLKHVTQVDLYNEEPKILAIHYKQFDEIWDDYITKEKMGIHD